MPRQYYLPVRDDRALAALFEQFARQVPTYAATLHLSAEDVAQQAADAAYFSYVVEWQRQATAFAQQATAWKNLLREGSANTGAGVAPSYLPWTGAVPVAVAPGVVGRFKSLVRRVKAAAAYNVTLGTALGIEGAEAATPDPTTGQPVLTASFSGGRLHLDWIKSIFDGIELWVDRGDGKFTFLAVDTVPDYVETSALPTTPTVWKYKAIYRLNDELVGQWSAVLSVPLGG